MLCLSAFCFDIFDLTFFPKLHFDPKISKIPFWPQIFLKLQESPPTFQKLQRGPRPSESYLNAFKKLASRDGNGVGCVQRMGSLPSKHGFVLPYTLPAPHDGEILQLLLLLGMVSVLQMEEHCWINSLIITIQRLRFWWHFYRMWV